MGRLAWRALWLACLVGCGPPRALQNAGSASLAPPVAERHPKAITLHGDTRVDDYAWLREKDSPEVLAYLRAENAYTDRMTRASRALEEALYAETLARIQQTDDTPPVRKGEYFYYRRTETGKQYPIYCRKHLTLQAPEEVLLDLNALAIGHSFLDLGEAEVSDDGGKLAYTLDTKGFREYALQVKDLASGQLGPERIEHVSSVAWAADGKTLFYVIEDHTKRPYRLYRHELGGVNDTLVYEERDERFVLTTSRSRSKRYVFVGSFSHTASEVRVLPAAQPTRALTLVAARREDHEYDVDHGGDRFYIRTNDKGRNFRIVTASPSDPSEANWQELVPVSEHVMLEDLAVFDRFYITHEREAGVPQLRVTPLTGGASFRVAMPEPIYELHPGENPESSSAAYRFSYESLTTPSTFYDFHVDERKLELIKRTAVLGGYDPTRYESERIFARAPDSVSVPISLVRARRPKMGPAPMLLVGYGAYGYPYPTTFSYSRVSLLDRGVTVGIAHVRGGGELGKRWHDEGRMLKKRNTFSDFIAVSEHLIAHGYTSADRLVIEGASAGGLLIGAVLNARPELYRAALLSVPFVDVLNTMSDPDLPLTVGEYEEWGNPAVVEHYRAIRGYCPYTNLRAQAYPALLVQSSYYDSQVMYWEPAKYVAKLRAQSRGHRRVLLRINMSAGHGGASGRYDALRERAFELAFALTRLGVTR